MRILKPIFLSTAVLLSSAFVASGQYDVLGRQSVASATQPEGSGNPVVASYNKPEGSGNPVVASYNKPEGSGNPVVADISSVGARGFLA